MAAWESVPACPVCGERRNEVCRVGRDRLHGFPGRFRYVRCARCGLLFMSPRPPAGAMGGYYPAAYEPHARRPAGTAADTRVRRLQRRFPFLARFKNRVLCSPYFDNVQVPAAVVRALGPGRRLLDVGCGNGSFLDRMRRETGCAVLGVDISPAAAASARERYGVEAVEGTVSDLAVPPGSFDAVTGWSCMEHVPDPFPTMARIAALVRPGGRVVLSVPNVRSFNAALFGGRWYHLEAPRHLCLFTPGAIRLLLERNGLRVVSLRHDRTPWGLLGSLQYLVFGDNLDPRSRNRIRSSRALGLLLLPFSALLAFLRVSDYMVVCARRPG